MSRELFLWHKVHVLRQRGEMCVKTISIVVIIIALRCYVTLRVNVGKTELLKRIILTWLN